jgi:hypothetical protein
MVTQFTTFKNFISVTSAIVTGFNVTSSKLGTYSLMMALFCRNMLL